MAENRATVVRKEIRAAIRTVHSRDNHRWNPFAQPGAIAATRSIIFPHHLSLRLARACRAAAKTARGNCKHVAPQRWVCTERCVRVDTKSTWTIRASRRWQQAERACEWALVSFELCVDSSRCANTWRLKQALLWRLTVDEPSAWALLCKPLDLITYGG